MPDQLAPQADRRVLLRAKAPLQGSITRLRAINFPKKSEDIPIMQRFSHGRF
ncbi:hypothetical protein K9U40_22275 [Xanthobacter autotrophicus]|uniref:hypothetical protein n=1 Tax=Xanthobacter TaxID=279 RepID=UPI0024AB5EEF|nr:hypothetical protein [Xanthobacter autotrophicus]MDI4667027.1 hypothetical protein [Xanthobacter autotrophicus]